MTDSQPDSLRALVRVMDRLRSPGGCPWDSQQTHESLVPYALEEAHELAEAIETGDRSGLREELGDLLLQVVFHARIATEHPTDPFDVDDVAADLVAKLVRRHPHVFKDEALEGDVHVQWDRLKNAEKQRERHAVERRRAGRAGLATQAPAGDGLGERLLALVLEGDAAGVDAEGALRRTAAAWEQDLRATESAAGT